MPDSDSLSLLCFSGVPEFLRGGQITPLPLKYRKAQALLGYLSAHAGRSFRREALAGLLWPDIESQAGRANLRLVLSDLLQALRALGLEAALQVHRDWLAWRPEPTLLTDLALWSAGPGPRHEALLGQLKLQERTWLEHAEEGTSRDFQAWLIATRQHLLQRRQALAAQVTVLAQALPAVPAPPPQIQVLTLLHVCQNTLAEDLLSDMRLDAPAWLERIGAEARFYGGQLIEHSDSGLTLAFGLDSRHTGQRWLALRCAGSLHPLWGHPQALSMALSAGRMLVSTLPRLQVSGWRKQLVARLALDAEVGEVVCDDSLRDLAPYFQMQDLGPRRFRGLQQAVRLYGRPLANMPPLMLPPAGDFSGSYFARAALLARPAAWLDQVRPGLAIGVRVQAEPGAGKTRLAWELAQRVQSEGRLAFWISALPEAQNIPWRGLHDFLGKLLGGEGTLDERLDRSLRQLQAELGESPRRALLALLRTGAVAQAHQNDLAEALSALLRGPGGRQVLVVVDDVQWLDGPSAGVLNRVIQRADPVLWLLTQRSGEGQSLQFGTLHELPLPALDDQAAEAILSALPDADQLSPEARQGRIVNARGLPLYLLADSVPQENGSHFSEFCQALLNRLGTARAPMEAAAVLGMLFNLDDLAALCDGAAAQQACEMALASGLIVARGEHQASFFHPRLREYLLSVIPPQVLQRHAATAAARMQARQEPAKAAQLWEQAGEPGRARQAWFEAAWRARDEDDISAACSHFARLTRLGYPDGNEGVRARLLHAHCLMARDGYGSTEAHEFVTAIAQADVTLQTLDPDTRFNFEMLAYLGSSSQGLIDGLDHAERLQASAATPAQHMTASWALGNTLFWLGRLQEARQWLQRCVEIALQLGPRERMLFFPSDLLVFAQSELAWVQWLLGDEAAAWAMSRAALEQAGRSSTEQDACIALVFAGLLAWSADDMVQTARYAEQAFRLSEAEGFVFWCAVAGLLLNLALARPGQPIDLAGLTRDSETMLAGYRAGTTTALWLVAASVVVSGQHAEADLMLQQALQACEQFEHRYCRMDLCRLRGLVLAAQGQPQQAREALAEAARLGREAGAEGWLRQWRRQLADAG